MHQQQPALVVQQQQEGVIQDMADAADEQLQAPPQHQDSEQEYVEVEVTTEVEEEVPVRVRLTINRVLTGNSTGDVHLVTSAQQEATNADSLWMLNVVRFARLR